MLFIEGTQKLPGWEVIPLRTKSFIDGIFTVEDAEAKLNYLWERQNALDNGDL